MRGVPQRCLERDAGRAGRGISARMESSHEPCWSSGWFMQQTHPGEGPHEVVDVNVGLFCVDVGADLQQVLPDTHIHQLNNAQKLYQNSSLSVTEHDLELTPTAAQKPHRKHSWGSTGDSCSDTCETPGTPGVCAQNRDCSLPGALQQAQLAGEHCREAGQGLTEAVGRRWVQLTGRRSFQSVSPSSWSVRRKQEPGGYRYMALLVFCKC